MNAIQKWILAFWGIGTIIAYYTTPLCTRYQGAWLPDSERGFTRPLELIIPKLLFVAILGAIAFFIAKGKGGEKKE